MEALFNTGDIIAIIGMTGGFITLAISVNRLVRKSKRRMIETAKSQQKRDSEVDSEIDKINGRVDENEKEITRVDDRIDRNLDKIYKKLDRMPKDIFEMLKNAK